MFSVLIPTRNEERNLPGCLASVSTSDDIHVLDSGSTDRTVETAREFGASVHHRPFDDDASQRNWALDHLPFRHPLVLMLDADERATDELVASIRAVGSADDAAAYLVRRRDFFLGRELAHCQVTRWYPRLVRPGHVRLSRLVHCRTHVDGSLLRLDAGHLVHFPFSKGVGQWVRRHTRYAALEALQERREAATDSDCSLRDILSPDPGRRRSAHKNLFRRLPMAPLSRPTLRFVWMYLLRGGFLDGRAGLIYCLLSGFYEFLITLEHADISDQP